MTAASKPYRWPWHGAFSPSKSALLVCSGDTPDPADEVVVRRLRTLADALQRSGVAIIALPLVETPAPLEASVFDAVVERRMPGGFTGTALEIVLRRFQRSDLLLAGFPFEIGADCTMRQANDLGFECMLIEDCCTGVMPDTFAGAVSSIQMSGGIFGTVATSADVMNLLQRYAAR